MDEYKTNLVIDSTTQKALYEEHEPSGCKFPVDFSFESVNDFVHSIEADYEDLQNLCLGMAIKLDKLNEAIKLQADYSFHFYEQYKDSDPERSKRHYQRYKQLINIIENKEENNEIHE